MSKSEDELRAMYTLPQWRLWNFAGLTAFMAFWAWFSYSSVGAGDWLAGVLGMPDWLGFLFIGIILLGPYLLISHWVLFRGGIFHMALVYRRVFLVALLVGALFALNELSKLGLSLKPPMAR
jgi:hypothetical protein